MLVCLVSSLGAWVLVWLASCLVDSLVRLLIGWLSG